MQPTVYAYDLGKAEGRRIWLTILLGAAIAGAGGVMVFKYELQTLGLGVMAAALVPVLLGLFLPYLRQVRLDQEWLRLDTEGPTLGRRGVNRHWHWYEISRVERHGWLHPAALLRGRFLTISTSGAGVPGSRSKVVIGDDYLTPIDEIAERLKLHMTQAASRTGRARRSASMVSPAIFWDREHKGRQEVFSPESLRTLFLWSLGLGLVGIGVVAYVAGWPPEWARLRAVLAEQTWIYSAVTGLVLMPLAQLGRISVMGNFLMLSGDGLHLRRQGQRRHWRWHELWDFDIRRQSPDLSADGHASKVFTFTARGDGTTTKRSTTTETQAFSIDDIYDVPLEDIARQLSAWSRLGREAEAVPEQTDQGDMKSSAPAALDSDELTFRWGARAGSSALMATALAFLILISTLDMAACLLFVLVLWPELDAASNRMLLLGVAGAFLIVPTIGLAIPLMAIRPRSNALLLDAEGFTYKRLGRRRRWSWREISGFQLQSGKLRWSSNRAGLVTFTAPRDDKLSRLSRWAYGIGGSQPIVVIEDAFDTPVDEIVRWLNDFQRRALAV